MHITCCIVVIIRSMIEEDLTVMALIAEIIISLKNVSLKNA